MSIKVTKKEMWYVYIIGLFLNNVNFKCVKK